MHMSHTHVTCIDCTYHVILTIQACEFIKHCNNGFLSISSCNKNTGETTHFPGRCIVALAQDPQLLSRGGKILLTCDLADEYGLRDIDGRQPANIRSLKGILNTPWMEFPGIIRALSWFIPSFIKIPRWMLHLASNKF